MKHSKYQQELGENAACTNRMTEATKGIGQKSIKGGTNNCLIFDSWFASKKATEDAMEVGAELIGMVKTNNKGVLEGVHREAYKGMAWRFLCRVEEQAYGTC